MIKNCVFKPLVILNLLVSPLSLALEIPGVVKYETVVQLSVPVSGVVNRVVVEEGQTVARGDLLLELDVTPFKANLDKIAAELRLLKAEFGLMEKEHDRNKELFDRMVLSTVTLQESELKLIRADSLKQAKEAEFTRVKYDFEKSRLTAPFAGRIVDRLVEPGQTIRSEMQAPILFNLANINNFIIEADIDGDKLGTLAYGVELKVRISGSSYSASVKSNVLLKHGRSLAQPAQYRVRVKLQDTVNKLRAGQPVILVLPGKQ